MEKLIYHAVACHPEINVNRSYKIYIEKNKYEKFDVCFNFGKINSLGREKYVRDLSPDEAVKIIKKSIHKRNTSPTRNSFDYKVILNHLG